MPARRALALMVGLALALASCTPQRQPARPAIWLVEGPGGQKAWLFGTIHAAPRPLAWRSEAVDTALREADEVIVEVADLDGARLGETFSALARTEGLPPLPQRVAPAERAGLRAMMKAAGLDDDASTRIETWAAALTLARSGAAADEPENGVDRAVLKAAKGKPVIELEGAAEQLGIFDGLPEKEQRDLLAAVVDEAGRADDDLVATWAAGDMAAIERETRSGLLADPELRQALFVARNARWSGAVTARMQRGLRPLVAVGAAHLASSDGLPAMLAARGFTVTRLQ